MNADGLQRTATLDRGRVQQHQLIVKARAVGGGDPDQPLDRVFEPTPALVETELLGQLGKQVAQALVGNRQEAPIGRDTHDRQGNTERDDLRGCDPSACVPWLLGQEIVGCAENGRKGSVEVGVHRGTPGRRCGDTADFGLSPQNPKHPVESTI